MLHPIASSLETVALFCLKIAYEEEGQSPILRDDLIMSDYHHDLFELLTCKGDVEGIRQRIDDCLRLALSALGGIDKPLGRELQRVSVDFRSAGTLEGLGHGLVAIREYLKAVH